MRSLIGEEVGKWRRKHCRGDNKRNFGMISFVNVALIATFTAFNRYGCWLRKDATFATYGLFGLIGMDWLALLLVVVSDIAIGIIVVESMLWKIKKVPISLGVLQ